MSRLYYDLHIHSCLSPCADNDSTPDSILGMGELNGLDIMALTDHNSTLNCPAFFGAAERHGIIPIAGMELTTAEDIHVVCLFETLSSALDFGKEVEKARIPIENKPKIFGDQLIVNQDDEIIGNEPQLLINATGISLEQAFELCEKFSGICYPAHIDRESNGIIAVLGAFPDFPKYRYAELHECEKLDEYSKMISFPKERFIVSSDAHYLWHIKEAKEFFELDADKSDADGVRRELFKLLRG